MAHSINWLRNYLSLFFSSLSNVPPIVKIGLPIFTFSTSNTLNSTPHLSAYSNMVEQQRVWRFGWLIRKISNILVGLCLDFDL